MDTSKIGNARQQDDNRMAVTNAKGLGECWQELCATFEQAELQSIDYQPEQMAMYRSMRAEPDSPEALAWTKSSIMADKATHTLRENIAYGDLPIWRMHNAREVIVAPAVLERDNVRYGIFKSNERPEPDMQGANLWVKFSDWKSFLARAVLPDPAKPRHPPNEPFVTLSEALSWIAFGVSMDSDMMHAVLDLDKYNERVPQDAVKAALAKLVALGSAGKIAMRGKYRASRDEDETALLTEAIDPIKLEDYRQFNYIDDELRHGEGMLFWKMPDGAIFHDSFKSGRRDSYTRVRVSRDHLLREYPPQAAAITDLTIFQPNHAFSRDDAETCMPWWSATQALAWIATRIPSYVEAVGRSETIGPSERTPLIVLVTCESQAAESDEGKAYLEARRHRWPAGTILAHAGRELLDSIRAGTITPSTSEGGKGRSMRWHEFAGVGTSEWAGDWLDLDPKPLFSAAEMMAVFPMPEHPAEQQQVHSGIVVPPAARSLTNLPPWLNPYELVAWVQYRDIGVVGKASDWNGLAAQHFYGEEPATGSVADVDQALQEGRLIANGLKAGETFAPVPAVEWTRIRLAPLDPSRQHPYVSIQFKLEEVVALFPAVGTEQTTTPKPNAVRRKPGPAPDPDWPHAIAKVTHECIEAGYKRPPKRGDKAAIQTMLLNFMAEKDKQFSDDIARKHAEAVIAGLPDT